MSNQLNTMEAVADILCRFPRFTITHHVDPDGDCLGSMIAMALMLQQLGKEVNLVSGDMMPARYQFLPLIKTIVSPEQVTDPGVLIAVDCGDLKRLGDSQQLLSKAEMVVNIDHHVSNNLFGQINWVDVSAAAVGEMIYQLGKYMSISFTRDMAIAIYTAISTDTGSFKYDNTSPKTHMIVSELLSLGVPVNEVTQKLFDLRSAFSTKLLAKVLTNLELTDDGQIAILTIPLSYMQEAQELNEETDGFINYGRNIYGVRVSALLKEVDNGRIKVGLRSDIGFDSSQLAKYFGGGGHPRAAGCLMEGSLENVKAQLLLAIIDRLKGVE